MFLLKYNVDFLCLVFGFGLPLSYTFGSGTSLGIGSGAESGASSDAVLGVGILSRFLLEVICF